MSKKLHAQAQFAFELAITIIPLALGYLAGAVVYFSILIYRSFILGYEKGRRRDVLG